MPCPKPDCLTCRIQKINDLSFWFEAVKAAEVPYPKTRFIITNAPLDLILDGQDMAPSQRREILKFFEQLKQEATHLGYPLFLRSGQTSNKHDWKNSCFVEKEEDMERHVWNIVEFSAICDIVGLPTYTWVLREIIKTEPLFYAFNSFPVTEEVRVFIKDGTLECWHPYWPAEVFEEHEEKVSDPDWREKLAWVGEEMNKELSNVHLPENPLNLAIKISQQVSGAWSIDFLKGKDGVWYCIDMAIASMSYHYPKCNNVIKDYNPEQV